MLVADASTNRVVGRSGVSAGDLAVLEPGVGPPATSHPRRLQPVRVRGDGVVEGLGAGEGGWFAVLRVHQLGTRIEARHFINPAAVHATVAIDTHGEVQDHGRREAWKFLPSLLPAGAIGDTVLSLLHRPGDDPPRLVQLPPAATFAGLTSGAEEYGLFSTLLPDRRHVFLQSGHGGERFVVWDALAGHQVADGGLQASDPMRFTSALSPAGTLWAASTDTLYELDPSTWEVGFSTRLRQEPTRCFVEWLSSVDGGRTVVIGWNRRTPPGAAEILALDTDTRTVERLARLPTWTSHAVLRREHGDLIAESWGDDRQYWHVTAQPEPHPLFSSGWE